MRLDKYLAKTGNGSRSEVKKLITSGKITVNDAVTRDPGAKVDEAKDRISVSGQTQSYEAFVYYMLNKPQGVISATEDHGIHADRCVTDLIREKNPADIFPVGRLDKDTEGLLLLTNDGDLAHRLLSPRKHVPKTYYAELDGMLLPEAIQRLEKGVDIGDDKPTLPCRIEVINEMSCRITVYEGRFHEVKRIFRTEGLTVTFLKRLSMGELQLDPELAPGEYRRLTEDEVQMLQK